MDNILVTSLDRDNIQRIKDALNAKFHITNLGACVYYLGITVTRDRINRIIRLRQASYVKRVLRDNGI